MSTELFVLALVALLQVGQLVVMAIAANREVGPAKTMSPRDPDAVGGSLKDQVSPRTGRLIRALDNHFEALILFTIAVVVVTLSNASSPITGVCAWLYLAARVLYVPAYVFGWVPGRSLIWAVGLLATVVMLVAPLSNGPQ